MLTVVVFLSSNQAEHLPWESFPSPVPAEVLGEITENFSGLSVVLVSTLEGMSQANAAFLNWWNSTGMF